MSDSRQTNRSRSHRSTSWRRPRLLAGLVAAGMVGGLLAAVPGSVAQAAAPAAVVIPAATSPATSLGLSVVSKRKSLAPDGPNIGDPVWAPADSGDPTVKGAGFSEGYKWQLQEDNSGDPDPNNTYDTECHPSTNSKFPEGCPWPSVHGMAASPVVSNGDQSDWNTRAALQLWDGTRGLKPGRYVLSVTAHGFQLGGTRFTWPLPTSAANGQATLSVGMNPLPIPLGTIRIQIFDDMASANGQWDQGAEAVPGTDLSGFKAQLADYLGGVTVDYWNNPLCTTYKSDANGSIQMNSDGTPVAVVKRGNGCISDRDGLIEIPNLAPNRYASTVTPPDESWVQTTTLEGNRDWDIWLMQNDTGNDTELVVGGEPVPWVTFGFVRDTTQVRVRNPRRGSGAVKGVLTEGQSYIPGIGGLAGNGEFTGTSGIKLGEPISDGYVALSDLQDGDRTIIAQPTNPDGSFKLTGLASGDYTLTVWDKNLVHILDLFQVSVKGNRTTDVGVLPIISWFTKISGSVFVDRNANGRRDPGEQGVSDFPLQNLDRTNNLFEQGQNTALTQKNGNYTFESAYPFSAFNVLQAFSPKYKTTGVTYGGCNDPKKHTVLTGAVDVSYLPIIAQCGTLDWGVQLYDETVGENGGVAGTVFYEAERANYAENQMAPPSYAVGVPGVTTKLYHPAAQNADGSWPTNSDGSIQVTEAGGNPYTGTQAETYNSESYARPKGCIPRTASGTPLLAPKDQDAAGTNPDQTCVEGPFVGVNFGLSDGADGQSVDGNYALTTPIDEGPGYYVASIDVPKDTVLANGNAGHDLFQVVTANDANFAHGEALVPQVNSPTGYAGLSWADIIAPPDAAQQPHVPDSPRYQGSEGTAAAPAAPQEKCVGANYTVAPTNSLSSPSFISVGGSPFAGDSRPKCDAKLFYVPAGQAVAPAFHIWTEVPLATKFFGYIVDDVSVSTDKKSLVYGEVAGVPNAPVGIYDWSGDLVDTVTSDYNGIWEALLPSSDIYNCPTPGGICPLVYRFVGNDPGRIGHANANYSPGYRTIAANFQAWPGNFEPADVAPTQSVVGVRAPSATFNAVARCQPTGDPQFFSASEVLFKTTTATSFGSNDPRTSLKALANLTIEGKSFGTATGAKLDLVQGDIDKPDKHWDLFNVTWTDSKIKVGSAQVVPPGAWQLRITKADGTRVRNTVTIHVLGDVRTGPSERRGTYTPNVIKVGPGLNRAAADASHFVGFDPAVHYGDPTNPGSDAAAGLGAIQHALEKATDQASSRGGNRDQLVVVYPAPAAAFAPFGTYYENLVLHWPIKIQGVGPGGVQSDGTTVQGTVIDGRYFWSTTTLVESTANPPDLGTIGDNPAYEPYSSAWLNFTDRLQANGWDGVQTVFEGADLTVFANRYGTRGEGGATVPAEPVGSFRNGVLNLTAPSFRAGIDGFTLQGGDQHDFPGNTNALAGRQPTAPDGAAAGAISTQGGAVFLNASVDWFRVANNLVQSNSASYGTIRVGTPYTDLDTNASVRNQTNRGVEIANNQILANGGTNLAGAVGMFDGSDGYRIHHNTLCGNSSTEYGGAISHYGLSNPLYGGLGGKSRIDHNTVTMNTSIDEGGGIMVAGELPPTRRGGQAGTSKGSGPVDIDHNVIAANVANDDGGGIRLLQTMKAAIKIENNTVTNNVSTHEGGGIAMDDAANVTVRFTTVARNITTATAVTSDGSPAPAGLSTAPNSRELQVALGGQAPSNGMSAPLIERSLFVDNRAGSWTASGVKGIGARGDTTGITVWDLGISGGGVKLSATNSRISADPAANPTGWTVGSGSARITTTPTSIFQAPYELAVDILPWRNAIRFRPAAIVSVSLPNNPAGGYRLKGTSGSANPAIDGAGGYVFLWSIDDIDGQARPDGRTGLQLGRKYDAGSDEVAK